MEPLQLIAYESSNVARQRLTSALPDAPRVHDTPSLDAVAVRTRMADLLRRTADRLDPRLAGEPAHRPAR